MGLALGDHRTNGSMGIDDPRKSLGCLDSYSLFYYGSWTHTYRCQGSSIKIFPHANVHGYLDIDNTPSSYLSSKNLQHDRQSTARPIYKYRRQSTSKLSHLLYTMSLLHEEPISEASTPEPPPTKVDSIYSKLNAQDFTLEEFDELIKQYRARLLPMFKEPRRENHLISRTASLKIKSMLDRIESLEFTVDEFWELVQRFREREIRIVDKRLWGLVEMNAYTWIWQEHRTKTKEAVNRDSRMWQEHRTKTKDAVTRGSSMATRKWSPTDIASESTGSRYNSD